MASAAPVGIPANDGIRGEESSSPSLKLDERNSLELVIAFTGAVGSGVTTVCDVLMRKLVDDFDYEPFYIKISDIIKEHSSEVGIDLSKALTPSQRVDEYQSAGNKLREKKLTYLADRAIERINALRRENKGVLEQVNAPDIPVQRRFAYVVDSLKNPAEVAKLRQIYGDLFWHVTVFAPDQVRETRLIAGHIEEDAVRHIMNATSRRAKAPASKLARPPIWLTTSSEITQTWSIMPFPLWSDSLTESSALNC